MAVNFYIISSFLFVIKVYHTQTADVMEASVHFILIIQLLNFIFMNLQENKTLKLLFWCSWAKNSFGYMQR